MMHAEDVLQRAQIPFVVLGTVANQMYHNEQLKVHKIVFGVLGQYAAAKELTGMLPAIEPHIQELTDGWQIIYEGIPVYIRILPKQYPTIINADMIFYMYDAWKIPNPFNIYWEQKDHYDI
jgi:hypothetical protein